LVEQALQGEKPCPRKLSSTSAARLVSALVIGLIISIFQAATQINEQTMTFIPKIVAVFITLLIFGPWIMELLITFTAGIFTQIATVGR
jgi:flagellar biosynthetic protein FliQ